MNMRGNPENLKPWKPGQSGNPNGRPPKGEALTDILREKVDKDAIAEKLIQMAMEKGDIVALRYIYDRIDGKPIETVNQNVQEMPKVIRFERAITDGADTGQDTTAMGESEEA